jgi:trehalose synthase
MADRNQTETRLLDRYEPEASRTPEEYEPYIGCERVAELKRLAAPLAGKSWANINSTFAGGGVAEMLRSLIPLARSLGIDAEWYSIRGHDAFYRVTKKFHNMLQGLDLPITGEEMYGTYLDTIDENAGAACIASDLVVVHDPQPAALVHHGVLSGSLLWQCHIDTSVPHPTVWRFLLPYINQYAGALFTMPDFVGPGVRVPSYTISPCIDPCAAKNRQYTEGEAQEILTPLFNEHDIDPERPILAAISRYDVHKNQATILDAYRTLCEHRHYNRPPYLIFLGNSATDDPEGAAVLAQLRDQAGNHPDVRFWVNVEDNDRVVGALMRIARAFIHVSTREGFGLVVSEALWQGTPVIGSSVGGITKQILDGQTGFLVQPTDVDGIAGRMAWVLDHPAEAAALGAAGKEHVRRNFLLPELLRRYLILLGFFAGVGAHMPRRPGSGETASAEVGH